MKGGNKNRFSIFIKCSFQNTGNPEIFSSRPLNSELKCTFPAICIGSFNHLHKPVIIVRMNQILYRLTENCVLNITFRILQKLHSLPVQLQKPIWFVYRYKCNSFRNGII